MPKFSVLKRRVNMTDWNTEQDVLKKVTAGFGLILKNERTTLASSNAFKRLIDKFHNTVR